jgi:hypothetical protein
MTQWGKIGANLALKDSMKKQDEQMRVFPTKRKGFQWA